MRLMISILMVLQLAGCIRQPLDTGYSGAKYYRPDPTVELSMFSVDDRVVSAFVRHSSGGVLFRLSSENSHDENVGAISGNKAVVMMSSAEMIQFSPKRYENFEQSFDMFQDGRIVVVPLDEKDGKAVGAFVNLISGRRYFLAPTVRSQESLVKVRAVTRRWPEVTVIVPDDARITDNVVLFPEFQR